MAGKKANIATEMDNANGGMVQEVVGFGPYQEGNKVGATSHETVSTGRAFQFVRVAYGLKFIPNEGQTLDESMDLAEMIVKEMVAREINEALGKDEGVTLVELPNEGRSLEITFGMTIPTARYQSEKFDVSLEVHIPNEDDFEESVSAARKFLELRMNRKMDEINEKVKGK